MTTFVALLRGINVSGKNKISMTDLKAIFKTLGFENVTTYIQSGNVIFSSMKEHNPIKISELVTQALFKDYQYNISTLVIAKSAFIEQVNGNPLAPFNLVTDGTKIMLTFLIEQPTKDHIEALLSHVKPPEKLYIHNATAYLHCPNGYGKSKLSNNFIENKLKVGATTRNAKTSHKLVELLTADPFHEQA